MERYDTSTKVWSIIERLDGGIKGAFVKKSPVTALRLANNLDSLKWLTIRKRSYALYSSADHLPTIAHGQLGLRYNIRCYTVMCCWFTYPLFLNHSVNQIRLGSYKQRGDRTHQRGWEQASYSRRGNISAHSASFLDFHYASLDLHRSALCWWTALTDRRALLVIHMWIINYCLGH